jgi:serine/threonine-protein kinase
VAQLLPDERARTEFLARTQRLAVAARDPVSTPSVRSGGAAVPLDETLVARAETVLAGFLGPVARVIVRRAAHRTSDPTELYRMLAAEIEGESRRTAFLAAVGAGGERRP